MQSSSDTGLRASARRRNSPDIHLAGVPATGAEYQVTVHRQLMGRETVIENLGVDLKKLSLLQSEFLELLEFCLDKNFHPKVLVQLYPSERYSLWCRIKGLPSSHTRQETFQPDS